MNTRRPLWAWLFFVQLALVAAATVLATRGALPTKVFQAPFDKIGHLAGYGLLSFLGVSFFGRARRWPVIGSLLIASAIDEFTQRLFPTRTFDLGDLAMNVVGIVVLGLVAAWKTTSARAAAECHQKSV